MDNAEKQLVLAVLARKDKLEQVLRKCSLQEIFAMGNRITKIGQQRKTREMERELEKSARKIKALIEKEGLPELHWFLSTIQYHRKECRFPRSFLGFIMHTEKQKVQSVSARPGRKIINVNNGQYCAEYLKRALVKEDGERFSALIKEEHKNTLGFKDKIGRLFMDECVFQKEGFILDINYEFFEEFIREYLTLNGRKKILYGAPKLKYEKW